MKKYLLLLVLICPAGVDAQQLVINSTTYYGGSQSEYIERIIPTTDRGFLAVGSTNSNNGNIPPHPFNLPLRVNILITKHDSLGALQWAKVFGGTDNEVAKSATQIADGGYAVACHTSSTDGDIPNRIGTGNLTNTSDIWVLRLDPSGNLLWSKVYGSSDNDQPSDIIATPDGGLLILSVTDGDDSDATGQINPAALNTDWLLM